MQKCKLIKCGKHILCSFFLFLDLLSILTALAAFIYHAVHVSLWLRAFLWRVLFIALILLSILGGSASFICTLFWEKRAINKTNPEVTELL